MSSISTMRFNFFGQLFYVFLLCLTAMALSSCDLAANYTKTDRAADENFQGFRDGLAERIPEVDTQNQTASAKGKIPELQPYLALSSSSMKSMPLVSVSVNQSVPIRDVLYELAQQAEYDLELDPNIRGSIIFTARNKPFDLVVERISDIAGLRYKFEDNFLRVEVDSAFTKTYKIDYLSFVRTNTGAVSTNVSVVSGEGADTGSNFSATSESTADFWGELELALTQMLGGASSGGLKTKRDPRISAVEQNPDVVAVAPQSSGDGVNIQAPEAVLRVESLPIDEEDNNNRSAGSEEGNGFTFSLNKQAGLINVFAPEKVQKQVEEYLLSLKKAVSSQVLVEAKIFEVSLFDEYITGIEWQAITGSGEGIVNFADATTALIGGLAVPGGDIATNSNFGIGYLGNDAQAFINAISGFGTVRALASPRLTVLNNQSAVLNVATNRVFFDIDIDREEGTDGDGDTIEIDTEIQSVPEGVLINVQPSINLDDRTISLFVRPTITRIVGTVQDPGVQFVAGGTGIISQIPEVNVQEIDTVIRVNSGQPIVMGGLLQDRIESTTEGVPIAGEIPIIGSLFKSQNDIIRKTELVIFLKATLLDSTSQTVHNTDKDIYRMFSGDRRPFEL